MYVKSPGLSQELHTKHIVILINKKELNESVPGFGYLGIALDIFFSAVICLLLLISSSSFQACFQCSSILFSPGSYIDFACFVPKVDQGFDDSI